jgi:RNA polymerase sigma-70 factor (ECF subfamily)
MNTLHDSDQSGRNSANGRERELLQRVARQDRAAFQELYLIYWPRLARLLIRMTSRPEIVQDVLQEVLLIVWQKAEQFRGESLVSTWIIGIAYRRAMRALRSIRLIAPIEQDLKLHEPDPQQALENPQWLARAMQVLPLEQRMVLELAYLMDLSCQEVAEIMCTPVNTVKTRMFHARAKLRSLLPRLATDNRVLAAVDGTQTPGRSR